MGKVKDLTGQKFGKLTVIERAENLILPCGQQKIQWLCRCDCGNMVIEISGHIKSGHIKSCGCYRKDFASEMSIATNTTHGKSRNNAYSHWVNAKQRCYNKNNKTYKTHGARGIIMYEPWRENFDAFYDYVSKLPHFGEKGYTLDRINNNGNYEPNNVRWATPKEQANNTRRNHLITYNGKTQTLAQWAMEYNIPYRRLYNRIYRGWSVEKALTAKCG